MSHHFRQNKLDALELRPECLQALRGLQSLASYPKDSVLFRQGQAAHGVYVLWSGRARLCIAPNCHGELALRVAGPGYLLGLPAAIRNVPHNFSARLLEDAEVGFVHRDDLLPLLRANHEVCLEVVQLLGHEVGSALDVMRSVRRGDSAGSRSIA